MQQATTAIRPNPATSGTPQSTNKLQNQFVINLCASTTPVGLTPPDHAGLKRFTFFVSRRREEGRERFRLHMGYFETQEEAERLLDIVREIYPGAWAGLAPGQRLRAQALAEAQAEAEAQAAASAQASAATAAPAAPAAPAVREPAPPVQNSIAGNSPEPAAAKVAAVPPTPPQVSAPQTATAPAAMASPAASPPAVPQAPAPIVSAAASLSLIPDQGRRLAVETPASSEPTASMAPAARGASGKAHDAAADVDGAARALSNVRAAIASLEDSTTVAPTLLPLPELKPAQVQRARGAAPVISERAALDLLEGRADTSSDSTVRQPRPPSIEASADEAPAARSLNSADRPREEKPAYAVQLLWSVQPIDIAQIPQLAIFSAYTLYGAEGNRDGRRWYGVRLGFFTDAVSAKQVAHYVRSDFSTVSVVPVTTRERERAKLAAARPDATPVESTATAAPTPAATRAGKPAVPAFEFIEDKRPEAAAQPPATPAAAPTGPAAPAGPAALAGPAARAPRTAPGKRAKLRPGRQVQAKTRSKPLTLEETLEILGADQLQMDDGRRALINDSTPRAAAPGPAKAKSSRITRLLERLSGIGS